MNTSRSPDPTGPTAGSATLAAEFGRQLRVLTELGAARPAYEFWWEPRDHARPVLVAKRLPGAAGRPHTVVTPDPAEMRAILGISQTHDQGSA
ncbi:MAG TPA: hypothetical protein DHU96_22840 [Actinobacteria bacterium]|nr:hypothetical protein [Actinomycetota bacterium]